MMSQLAGGGGFLMDVLKRFLRVIKVDTYIDLIYLIIKVMLRTITSPLFENIWVKE
jgi:hypothetical protein